MNLKDLLDLVEKDKEAGYLAFCREFGTNRVSYFDQFHYSNQDKGYNIDPTNQHLCIEKLELMKKFLYHFGHSMKEFQAMGNDSSSFAWIDLIDLILTHCTILKKLHLLNNFDSDDPLEVFMKKVARVQLISKNPLRITKQCSTIETLKIESIYLDSPLKITEQFPNLRSLDLMGILAADPTFIEVNIPKLDHLGITLATEFNEFDEDWDTLNFCIPSESDEEGDTLRCGSTKLDPVTEEEKEEEEEDVEEGSSADQDQVNIEQKTTDEENEQPDGIPFNWNNIKNALILNPQLTSIQLEMEIRIPIIQFLSETLPNLQTIELSLSENDFDFHQLKSDIIFQNVKSATLGHLGRTVPPILFEKLEILHFTTAAYSSTIDFIKKHQHLETLHLSCEYTDIQALRAVKSLPELKHLYIMVENEIKWSARVLVRFLAECERLDTLMLVLVVDSSDQRNWRSLVAKVWQIEEGYSDEMYTIEKTIYTQ